MKIEGNNVVRSEALENTCNNCKAKLLGFCVLSSFNREQCKENLWVTKLYQEINVNEQALKKEGLI